MAIMPGVKLASYNIRKAIGLDRRRDPGRIIDVINQLGADGPTGALARARRRCRAA